MLLKNPQWVSRRCRRPPRLAEPRVLPSSLAMNTIVPPQAAAQHAAEAGAFPLPLSATSPLPRQPVWRSLNVSFLLQARPQLWASCTRVPFDCTFFAMVNEQAKLFAVLGAPYLHRGVTNQPQPRWVGGSGACMAAPESERLVECAQEMTERLWQCTNGNLGEGQLGQGITSELLVNVDSRASAHMRLTHVKDAVHPHARTAAGGRRRMGQDVRKIRKWLIKFWGLRPGASGVQSPQDQAGPGSLGAWQARS